MHVIESGHKYHLANLKNEGVTELTFYKDPAIHSTGYPGTSCQEVIRALIDRVLTLDNEKPWSGNESIIQKAREMLALFEMRALQIKVEKGLAIEILPVGSDGHIQFLGNQ